MTGETVAFRHGHCRSEHQGLVSDRTESLIQVTDRIPNCMSRDSENERRPGPGESRASRVDQPSGGVTPSDFLRSQMF